MTTEHQEAALWYALRMWVEDARLDDLIPQTTSTRIENGTVLVTAESESRGRVSFSVSTFLLEESARTLTQEHLRAFRENERDLKAAAFEIVRSYAQQLDERIRVKPAAEKAKRRSDRAARALELADDGMDHIAIARTMLKQGLIKSRKRDPTTRLENARRSVQRWLETTKK